MIKWDKLREWIVAKMKAPVYRSGGKRIEMQILDEMDRLEAEHPEPVPRLDIHGRVISTAGLVPSAEACEAAEAILEREADKIERTRWSPDSWEYHARQASGARIVRDYLRSLHGPGKEGK